MTHSLCSPGPHQEGEEGGKYLGAPPDIPLPRGDTLLFRAGIHVSFFPQRRNVLKPVVLQWGRRNYKFPGSLFGLKVLLIISLLLLSVWILCYYCVICIVNSSQVQQFQLNCTVISGFQYEITAVNNKIRPLCRYIDSFPNSFKKALVN